MAEYDAIKIKQFYGVVDKYYAPGEKTGGQTHGVGWGARNYHNGISAWCVVVACVTPSCTELFVLTRVGNGNGPAKRAGEQTDYGDYTLLILEHLAAESKNPHALASWSFNRHDGRPALNAKIF